MIGSINPQSKYHKIYNGLLMNNRQDSTTEK